MKGVGKGMDSPGSEWILQVLEKQDERPVWFCVWGGTGVLAQALWKISQTKKTSGCRKAVPESKGVHHLRPG